MDWLTKTTQTPAISVSASGIPFLPVGRYFSLLYMVIIDVCVILAVVMAVFVFFFYFFNLLKNDNKMKN